jgi:psiF repeat
MSLGRIGRRWLATFALGTVAPLVLAQMTPPAGAGAHGPGRDGLAWQDCRKQADEQKLAAGDERRKFMRQCLEAKEAGSDARKPDVARSTSGDPLSGQPHSDPPAWTPSPQQ